MVTNDILYNTAGMMTRMNDGFRDNIGYHPCGVLKLTVPDMYCREDIIKRLREAGFDLGRRICRRAHLDSFEVSFYQAVAFDKLLMKNFKWNYEPKWKRRKRILMRKYEPT